MPCHNHDRCAGRQAAGKQTIRCASRSCQQHCQLVCSCHPPPATHHAPSLDVSKVSKRKFRLGLALLMRNGCAMYLHLPKQPTLSGEAARASASVALISLPFPLPLCLLYYSHSFRLTQTGLVSLLGAP